MKLTTLSIKTDTRNRFKQKKRRQEVKQDRYFTDSEFLDFLLGCD